MPTTYTTTSKATVRGRHTSLNAAVVAARLAAGLNFEDFAVCFSAFAVLAVSLLGAGIVATVTFARGG